MTIVERTRPVTGGVDTHLDVHVAAVVDQVGGVRRDRPVLKRYVAREVYKHLPRPGA